MYMAYFEPRIYQAVNAGPLRLDVMKFYCTIISLPDKEPNTGQSGQIPGAWQLYFRDVQQFPFADNCTLRVVQT